MFMDTLYDGELPVFLGNSPFLKAGFNKEYDDAILAREKGKDWILELEEKEKSFKHFLFKDSLQQNPWLLY